MSNLITETFTN